MELTEAMCTVGTCRYYRDEPVPDAVLRTALDAARFAPQGGNRQAARWVVVRDPALKQALADLYLPLWRAYFDAVDPPRPGSRRARAYEGARCFAENLARVPVIAVLCAKEEHLRVTDDRLGRTSVVGGASIYPTMQNFCLALRDQGVASTVTTLLCQEESAVCGLLGIPPGYLTAAHIAAADSRSDFVDGRSGKRCISTVSVQGCFRGRDAGGTARGGR